MKERDFLIMEKSLIFIKALETSQIQKVKVAFRPFEKKFNTIKKCFYCKKLGHVIKDFRIRIVVEKRAKQTNIITKPCTWIVYGYFDNKERIYL